MKIRLTVVMLVTSGLTVFSGNIFSEYKAEPCDIEFKGLHKCNLKQGDLSMSAELVTRKLADDEKLLESITITRNGIKHQLKISPDTTFLEGDIGYISFDDINFDGIPDAAITTSFGTPNLYLDYWVYVTKAKHYKKIGNYSRFKLDPVSKTVSTITKINAANYKKVRYKWNKYDLITTSR
ncbi:MAG: hypothetical protein OEY52_15745 [Gammaproteobacteria bacterium]|nr:hypothetical protein [Gammaproteobacteria bacterium]